jgi:hypothetical protein
MTKNFSMGSVTRLNVKCVSAIWNQAAGELVQNVGSLIDADPPALGAAAAST